MNEPRRQRRLSLGSRVTESDNGGALNCFCNLYSELEYHSSAIIAGGIEKLTEIIFT